MRLLANELLSVDDGTNEDLAMAETKDFREVETKGKNPDCFDVSACLQKNADKVNTDEIKESPRNPLHHHTEEPGDKQGLGETKINHLEEVASVKNNEIPIECTFHHPSCEANNYKGDNIAKVDEGDNMTSDDEGDDNSKGVKCDKDKSENGKDANISMRNDGDNISKNNEDDNTPKDDKGDTIGDDNNDDAINNTINNKRDNSTDRIENKPEVHKRSVFILIVINVVAFIASFSYWNQNGVLPYLTRKLGVNPEIYGLMESSFAIYQLIGSPIFGRCGDLFGTRIVMIGSEIASAVSYGSLAFVNNIPTLFLSRVPAFFMHNLQGSYMIITDVTLPAERASMLGKLGVSHGLGMVAGSFAGGLVTDIFNERTTTIVAACGNLVCVVILVVLIPNDTKTIRRQLEGVNELANEHQEQVSITEMFSLKQMCAILRIDIIKYLLFIKVLSAFPFSLLYSMFSIAIMDFYHLGPYHNGLILAYVGLVGIFVQGYLIGLFTKHARDPDLVKYAVYLMTCTFLFLTVAEHIVFFCILLVPLAIGGITSHLVLLAAITKVVPINDTGTAIGLTLALHAIVRSIAPTIGGMVFTNIGWPFFGVIGYVIHLFLAGFILLNGKENY